MSAEVMHTGLRFATTAAPLTAGEARVITDTIKEHTTAVWNLLIEAHERQAWKALGYSTWAAYVSNEFNLSRSRSYQLIDQARTIHAIEAAVSTVVDISERETRDIKDDLPEVIAEIEERLVSKDVDTDDEKRAVVADVIAQRRAVQVDDFTVDLSTGEIVEEPAPGEVTRTETFKTTETHKRPEPKPVPTGDDANRANAVQAAKSIGRSLEALQYLNYENARHGIVTDWWPLGRHEVPPEQAAYFTPAELRKLAQGLNQTADLLEAHHVD